jgi:hypothetical protein
MKDLLRTLNQNPEFQAVMGELKKHRPIVPEFKLQKTRDAQEQLLDQIKFQSGRKEGFDFLFSLLTTIK